VGVLGRQKHQPRGWFIGDAAAVELGTVDPCESTAVFAAGLLRQEAIGFNQQLLPLAQVALAVVLSGSVEVGAGVDPIAVAVLLDVAAAITEAP
jgi:hypothetical protein